MITYLAGAYGRKAEIKAYAKELREIGEEVQASWLDEPDQYTYQTVTDNPELGRGFAIKALHDIQCSRRIIVFTGDLGRGGNQLEQGFAMALGLEVIIVGPDANLFSLLANRKYKDWEEFKSADLGIEREVDEDAVDDGGGPGWIQR